MSALLNHRLKAALGLGIAWLGRTPQEIEDFLNSYEAEVLREAAERIRGVASKTRMAADRPALRHAADLIDPNKEN